MVFANEKGRCLGEIQNISLGGMKARVPKDYFSLGDEVMVSPKDSEDVLVYRVCWELPVGGGFELGFIYPNSVAGFWHSWAADLIAGARPTMGEVMERRAQIRLNCSLKGGMKIKRKQFDVRVLDIGAGGALVEFDDLFKTGQTGHLTIKSPVRVGHVPFEIVRVWEDKPTRLGLAFINTRERHRLAMVRLLDVLMRRTEAST